MGMEAGIGSWRLAVPRSQAPSRRDEQGPPLGGRPGSLGPGLLLAQDPKPSRPDPVRPGDRPAGPFDLQPALPAAQDGEGGQGGVSRQVAAPGPERPALPDPTREEADPGADSGPVGRPPLEPHRDAGPPGQVAEQQRLLVELVDHHVLVPVSVQVGQGHPVGDAENPEAPACLLEGGVPPVAEGDVALGQGRMVTADGAALAGLQAERADAVVAVPVHHVEGEAVAGQQVLVAVEVHVQEYRAPGPAGGRHPGGQGRLGVGAVPPGQVEGVAVVAGPPPGRQDGGGPGVLLDQLGHPPCVLPAHHVQHHDVLVAVVVQVGEVHPHGGAAGVAQHPGRGLPEGSSAAVDPDAVGRGVVVAHVEVGKPVVVQVGEGGGQAPVPDPLQGLPGPVEEGPPAPAHRQEAALALVEVELVALGQLHQPPLASLGGYLEAPLPAQLGHGPAVDVGHPVAAVHQSHLVAGGGVARVHHVDVVGAVEVQVAVGIHVGQGQGGGRGVPGEARAATLGEDAGPVVQEEPDAAGHPAHQEVGVPVPVDVGQRRPGGPLAGAGGLPGRDLLEAPAPPVEVEPVGPLQGAEVDVGPAVAVDVAQGQSRAVVGHHARQVGVPGERVAEVHPGPLRGLQLEARPSLPGRGGQGTGVQGQGRREQAEAEEGSPGGRVGSHSHSMVAGGLLEMSMHTRLAPSTSLRMREEILSRSPRGRWTQSAVIPSRDSTTRTTMVYS